MKKQSSRLQKILLIAALFFILVCPLLFVGGRLFPSSIGFLKPIFALLGCIWNRKQNPFPTLVEMRPQAILFALMGMNKWM